MDDDTRRDIARRKARSSRPHARLKAQILKESTLCYLCGHEGADSIDHVIPVKMGGQTTRANLRPAHLTCNKARGTMGVAEARMKLAGSRDTPGRLPDGRYINAQGLIQSREW